MAPEYRRCPRCKGTGCDRYEDDLCPECWGDGEVMQGDEPFDVAGSSSSATSHAAAL